MFSLRGFIIVVAILFKCNIVVTTRNTGQPPMPRRISAYPKATKQDASHLLSVVVPSCLVIFADTHADSTSVVTGATL